MVDDAVCRKVVDKLFYIGSLVHTSSKKLENIEREGTTCVAHLSRGDILEPKEGVKLNQIFNVSGPRSGASFNVSPSKEGIDDISIFID